MRLSRRDEAWMREQIPLPLERAEVAEIHQEMLRRRQKDRWFLTAYIAALMIPFGLAEALDGIVFHRDFAGRTLKILFATVLIGGMWMFITWLFERRFATQLRTLLRERGHEVCLPCGYCLAGLGDDINKCPECGAEREPMPEVNE